MIYPERKVRTRTMDTSTSNIFQAFKRHLPSDILIYLFFAFHISFTLTTKFDPDSDAQTQWWSLSRSTDSFFRLCYQLGQFLPVHGCALSHSLLLFYIFFSVDFCWCVFYGTSSTSPLELIIKIDNSQGWYQWPFLCHSSTMAFNKTKQTTKQI